MQTHPASSPRLANPDWFTGPSEALAEIRSQAALLLAQERRQRKSLVRLSAAITVLALSAPVMAIATVGDPDHLAWPGFGPGVLALTVLAFAYIFSRYLEARCGDIPIETCFSNQLHLAIRRNWIERDALIPADGSLDAGRCHAVSDIDRLIVADLLVIHDAIAQQRQIKPLLIGEGLRLGK